MSYGKLENNSEINNMIEEKRIKTKNHEFKLEITKIKSGDIYYTILNKKGEYCIRIKRDKEIEKEIFIQYLNYYKSCSQKNLLEMLLGMLEYIRESNKGEELKYYLEDDSTIEMYGKKIKLNIIYILMYGKTWYMKNVEAIPISNEFVENLEKINNYMINNKDKLIHFFNLKEEMKNIENNKESENNKNNIIKIPLKILEEIKKNKNNNITSKSIISNIKKIYRESKSSREFLNELYKKYGMKIYLIIDYYSYYEYIAYKLKSQLYFNTYMEIPLKYIEKIDVLNSVE